MQCYASPLFSLFCFCTPSFLFSTPLPFLTPPVFNRWQKMWDELNAMHRLTKGKLGRLQQGSDRLAPEARSFLSLKPLNCCRTLRFFLFFSHLSSENHRKKVGIHLRDPSLATLKITNNENPVLMIIFFKIPLLKAINPQMPGSNNLHSLPNFHEGADPDSGPNTRNVCIILTSGCLPTRFTPSNH